MSCHRMFASGVILVGLAGCATQPPSLAAQALPELPPAARSQKPEGENLQQTSLRSLLNTSPERVADPKNGQVTANIRATVGTVPILDEEVRDASFPYLIEVARLQEPDRTKALVQIFSRELQRLVEREVILQDAYTRLSKGGQKYLNRLKEAANKEFDRQVRSMKERAGVKSDDELKDVLKGQGLSLEGMRRQFEQTFVANQYMRSRMEPAVEKYTQHEYIVEYYQQHPEEFQIQDAVQWQDIFLALTKHGTREAALATAQQIIQRSKDGEDFTKLSAQFDNGDSSYRNGEGLGKRRGEVRPVEAEKYLFTMKDGEIGPILEQANGFHIIRLVKRDYAGKVQLDEKTQTKIKDKLRDEVNNREYKRIVIDLKRNAVLEYSTKAPQ